jgi:hypothetical protein
MLPNPHITTHEHIKNECAGQNLYPCAPLIILVRARQYCYQLMCGEQERRRASADRRIQHMHASYFEWTTVRCKV